MAIAPFDRLLLPRLRRAQRQRSYARYVQARWAERFPARVLPTIGSLVLQLRPLPANGQQANLWQALELDHRIRLVGSLGSGRSFVLINMLLQWCATQERLPGLFPILLHVPSATESPDATLARTLAEAGFANDRMGIERGLASGKWMLLLDDLEEAQPHIAEHWRNWLFDLTERYPALSVVATDHTTNPTWPGWQTWQVQAPDASILEQWLRQLLPNEEPALLLPPLLNDGRGRLVAERFADVAILAAIYPTHGFSANRVRMYAAAVDRSLRPVAGADLPKVRTALAGLGYAWLQGENIKSVYWLQPSLLALNGLVQVDQRGLVRFRSPLFALFCAALHVAAHHAWHEFDLDNPLWHELLPLTAGLLADPAPLYSAIRGSSPLTSERVLLLGRCLREHHVPIAGWSAAIIRALVHVARHEPAYSEQIWHLLASMESVVSATIAEQLSNGPDGEAWALQVVRSLPSHLALDYLLDMLSDSRLGYSTRQSAAQQLFAMHDARLTPRLISLAQRQHDDWGQLLVHYLLAHNSHAGRYYLQEQLHAGRMIFYLQSEPNGARFVVATASALLDDHELDQMVHLHGSLALQGCATERTAPALLIACTAASAPLRAAARQALLQATPSLAVRALGRLVLGDDVHWTARYEALHELMRFERSGANPLLLRVVTSQLPLAARLEAAQTIMQRQNETSERLIRLLEQPQLGNALRSGIIYRSDPQTQPLFMARLLGLACDQSAFMVRAAAISTLAKVKNDESQAVLAGIVEHERHDLQALLAAIVGLGTRRDESGIWALRSIIIGELPQQLELAWQQELPMGYLHEAPQQWPVASFPPALQWRWAEALAVGNTSADPPTSLAELIGREVHSLRSAAAQALSTIGGSAARSVLYEALTGNPDRYSLTVAPVVAAQLANCDAEYELAQTVGTGQPLLRWVAANTLSQQAQAKPSLHQMLINNQLDPQTRSAMLTALSGDNHLAPLLETMIVDDHTPLSLRVDAVHSFHKLHMAHSEGLMLALLTSNHAEPALHVAALDCLLAPVSEASLNIVRQILRDPRPILEVAAAALRCLGRVADRESIALFLRYAQHDSPSLAIPAMDGLRLLQEPTAIALLNRLAQAGGKSTRIRLHALRVLLELEGAIHLGLVRELANTGSIGTRLLALEILLAAAKNPLDTLEFLRPHNPLPLRLRVAQALAEVANETTLQQLAELLHNDREALAIRSLALSSLCQARYMPVLGDVEALAADQTAPLMLRRRAITGLRAWRNEPTTMLTLSQLAESADPASSAWALAVLLDLPLLQEAA